MTRPAPRSWGRFTHLTPYHRNNSVRGLKVAARTTRAIDLDVQVTADGVLVCTHWGRPLLLDGYRDPAGKIRLTRHINTLTLAEVSRLRTRDGYRIWTLRSMLRRSAKLGLRVEIEAKESRALERRKTWKPVARQVQRLKLNAVVKTISDLGGRRRAGRRMRAAHRAGLSTMLLPRRRRLMAARFRPYVDYVRGSIKWIEGVLVYDCEGYFMGSSLAQKLAIEGKEVTLVTPADQVGSYLFHTDEGGHVMHALLDLGVQLVTSHSLSRIEPGKVIGHNVYHAATEASWTVDSVVLVTQRQSRNDLYEQLTAGQERLSGAGITQVLRIGDCVEPRVIAEAVFDGHRLGREIDTSDPATPLPFIREQRILGWREEDYDGVLRHVLPLTPVSKTTHR